MSFCTMTTSQERFVDTLTVHMKECDGQKTLALDFERLADNSELTWFLAEFCNHRFIMKECAVSAEKKVSEPQLVLYKTRDGSLVGDVSNLLPRKFRVRVSITFHEHIHKPEQFPDFVRLFAGLDEGELPEMPKPMTVWERLRAPLV